MPEIGRIQSTNFQALLTSLGITRNNIPFALRSEVTPVVLVGGTVSFLAAPTPAYSVTDIFTAGLQVAPAAGTVLADTGALPVGAYSLQAQMYAEENNEFDLEWRNAGNSANLRSIRFNLTPGGSPSLGFSSRFNVENADERFRILNVRIASPAIDYQAFLLVKI